jgi:hypothetical protein
MVVISSNLIIYFKLHYIKSIKQGHLHFHAPYFILPTGDRLIADYDIPEYSQT